MNLSTHPARVVAAVAAVIAAGTTTVLALTAGSAVADEPGRCTQDVNVRQEPDLASPVVGLCETGTPVDLGVERGDFVQLDELGGWAATDYVTLDATGTDPTDAAVTNLTDADPAGAAPAGATDTGDDATGAATDGTATTTATATATATENPDDTTADDAASANADGNGIPAAAKPRAGGVAGLLR